MSKTISKIYNPVITVCDNCFRACCWQGEFMCDNADAAGTITRKVSELIAMDNGEHPDYWNEDLWTANKPLLTPEYLKLLGACGDQLELKEFKED